MHPTLHSTFHCWLSTFLCYLVNSYENLALGRLPSWALWGSAEHRVSPCSRAQSRQRNIVKPNRTCLLSQSVSGEFCCLGEWGRHRGGSPQSVGSLCSQDRWNNRWMSSCWKMPLMLDCLFGLPTLSHGPSYSPHRALASLLPSRPQLLRLGKGLQGQHV